MRKTFFIWRQRSVISFNPKSSLKKGYHHGGTTKGFVVLITFIPEKEIYVVAMANYSTFYDVRSGLAYFLIDLVNKGLLLTKK